MKLYWVVAIKRSKDGDAIIVREPKALLARDENHARELCAVALATSKAYLNEVEIIVRPF